MRSFLQTMASQAFPLAMAAVAGVFLARGLQPEGRGVYATVTTTAGIATVVGHMSVGRSQMALWPSSTATGPSSATPWSSGWSSAQPPGW